MSALVWFRSDLRENWHGPLEYALANHDIVTAVFFVTPKQWQAFHLSVRKTDLILRRIEWLRARLKQRGVHLNILQADDYDASEARLVSLIEEHQFTHLYFNAEYEWDERQRDRRVKKHLEGTATCGVFHDTCLVRPDKILNQQGKPYKVFTPFFKAWLTVLSSQPDYAHAEKVSAQDTVVFDDDNTPDKIEGWRLDHPDTQRWPHDDDSLSKQLSSFIQERGPDYKADRDKPQVDGTSELSAHLSIGAVAPAQIYHMLKSLALECMEARSGGQFEWFREIAWRDFYRYVMYQFPHVSRGQCFQTKYNGFPWSDNQAHFEAWKAGRTGYPIVDAAMRCLNETGWMHNRLRMIVSSFLCKHIRLPWQWGEIYFMEQLIDGDYASNNGGWQWSASVGTDAAPYFRIFNPASQGERYDPEGQFLLQWVPELKGMPRKYLYQPSAYSEFDRFDYPAPIVDHKTQVADTKALFKDFLDSQ